MNAGDERHRRDITQRLAAAGTTINAPGSGHVDAVLDADIQRPVPLAMAHEALRASEERYRYIVETTSEGIWLTDGAHQTTFMNQRMVQMLGCEADPGRSPFDFLDEDGQAELTARLECRRPHQTELRFVRRDGLPVWTLVDGTPIVESDGRHNGWLTMVKDISARKQTERVLTEQAALLELTPDADHRARHGGPDPVLEPGRRNAVWVAQGRGHRQRRCATLLQTGVRSAGGRDRRGVAGSDGRWAGEVTHLARDGRRLHVVTRWMVQRDAAGDAGPRAAASMKTSPTANRPRPSGHCSRSACRWRPPWRRWASGIGSWTGTR